MTRVPEAPATGGRGDAARNVSLVARREYAERVRSRAFVFSTLLLAGLAMMVALIPLGVRVLDRATVTRVAVTAPEAALAAVDMLWPEVPTQRCTVHKHRNLLAHAPDQSGCGAVRQNSRPASRAASATARTRP